VEPPLRVDGESKAVDDRVGSARRGFYLSIEPSGRGTKVSENECCAPISYVYGGVSLSPKPPGQLLVGVRVIVGGQVAPLTGPEAGSDHLLWHYLVAVKPGPTKIVCSVGDVTSTKNVETRTEETSIVNFCYGKPVVSSNVRGLGKVRVRRREQAKQTEPAPPAQGLPKSLS